jgi:hypothetical protein
MSTLELVDRPCPLFNNGRISAGVEFKFGFAASSRESSDTFEMVLDVLGSALNRGRPSSNVGFKPGFSVRASDEIYPPTGRLMEYLGDSGATKDLELVVDIEAVSDSSDSSLSSRSNTRTLFSKALILCWAISRCASKVVVKVGMLTSSTWEWRT